MDPRLPEGQFILSGRPAGQPKGGDDERRKRVSQKHPHPDPRGRMRDNATRKKRRTAWPALTWRDRFGSRLHRANGR